MEILLTQFRIRFDVINPANQSLVGSINEAMDDEIDLAIDSAKNAFQKRILQDMDAKDKSKMMRAIGAKLREYSGEGGKLLSLENGKTISQCVGEFKGAADTFDFYAGMTDKIENKLIPSGKDTFNYVVLEPFGVSLQIVPWNYPVSIFSGMVAQNLIVGNTIVIKPPELCPLSTNFYGRIFKEVGVTEGIINIVHGRGEVTGRKLVKHNGIDYIVFTGSPEVASEILKETADRIIPCHFELGGKSAAIIYPDADIDKAVDSTVKGIFKPNAGQICVAMSRVVVHPKIKNEYMSKLISKTKKLKIGSGADNDTDVTPLISKEQIQRVSNYVKSGIQSGAELTLGGNEHDNKLGNFYEPTIFNNVSTDSTILKKIFGPVTTVFDFEDEEGN